MHRHVGKHKQIEEHRHVDEWVKIDCGACRAWSTTRKDPFRALAEFEVHCEGAHPFVKDPPYVRTHNVTVVVTRG